MGRGVSPSGRARPYSSCAQRRPGGGAGPAPVAGDGLEEGDELLGRELVVLQSKPSTARAEEHGSNGADARAHGGGGAPTRRGERAARAGGGGGGRGTFQDWMHVSVAMRAPSGSSSSALRYTASDSGAGSAVPCAPGRIPAALAAAPLPPRGFPCAEADSDGRTVVRGLPERQIGDDAAPTGESMAFVMTVSTKPNRIRIQKEAVLFVLFRLNRLVPDLLSS